MSGWTHVLSFLSEYYFSTENLERDFFLRRKMDEQGFLPISLIAGFHRVQALTTNLNLILEVNIHLKKNLSYISFSWEPKTALKNSVKKEKSTVQW